ncbi:MAG: hypothetical protein HON65_03905 [Rhodospirillales bacterium]|nr:hypothetical protein [Rhodospirillales bacterium]
MENTTPATGQTVSEDVSSISSPETLYAVVFRMVEETIRRYEHIKAEQTAHQNAEVASVFQDLVEMERARLDVIKAQAGQELEKQLPHEIQSFVKSNERAGLIEETRGNPYLLTPYKALQLAVMDKIWVFERILLIISAMENERIQEAAEKLAMEELELAAELRIKRRIAYRFEKDKEISGHHLDENEVISDIDGLAALVADASTAICTVAGNIEHSWGDQLPPKTKKILASLRVTLCKHTDCTAFKPSPEEFQGQRDDDLFSALRRLLRELEATCDSILSVADVSLDEEVVERAQKDAQMYVGLLAQVSDELVSASH